MTPAPSRSPRCEARSGARPAPTTTRWCSGLVEAAPAAIADPHPGRLPPARGLCEITPGGVPQVITASRAAAILAAHAPAGPVATAWHDLAAGYMADLRRIDAQLCEVRATITAAVRASGTTLTEVIGVGPVIAAAIIGDVGDATRFPTADRFAAYTAPRPSRCPPAAGRSAGYPCAATGASTTPST
jgi:transposase IS116/IS110/IS902 family protein